MTKNQVLTFLKKDVPGESAKFALWQKQAARVGPSAAPICLAILRTGSHPRHYSALLTLRAIGYKAEQSGHGSHAAYSVTAPETSTEIIIHPAHTAPDLGTAAQWLQGCAKSGIRKKPFHRAKAKAARKKPPKTHAAHAA